MAETRLGCTFPDIGIHGNCHFSFADVNNLQIADIFSQWLAEHHLDRYNYP